MSARDLKDECLGDREYALENEIVSVSPRGGGGRGRLNFVFLDCLLHRLETEYQLSIFSNMLVEHASEMRFEAELIGRDGICCGNQCILDKEVLNNQNESKN